MLETLTADQRARLRQQLDEMDAMESQSAQASEEAVSQDFAESYTPQRDFVDQAAQLLNQTEQASGQSSGIDPYAGQDNSFLSREPQSEKSALNFLSDPYGSVMKTIAPNQSVPPKPMSPLTSSVVETVAPTPKQVVTPLEQRGAKNVKVPPPTLPKTLPTKSTVSVQGSRSMPVATKGESTEAKPLEQRNIEDIDKQLTALESEQAGMTPRFELGVEAEKSKFGIEQEVAGEGARRQGEFMLQESQIAEDYKTQAQKRIEEGERIIKERLPVDPNRWFNSRSLGQKVAFAIALGFDKTGKNTQFLMNLINQDIAAQEKEYDQKGKDASNMFAVAKELLGNSQAARKATQEAFKSYTEKLAEAQKAGLNINSPQVQYKVANDLTKVWQENMKLQKDFIGAQLDAQKATQERRYNDQKLDIDRQKLAQDWARIKIDQAKVQVPDEMDRRLMPPILTQARNANNMEKLEQAGFDPQTAGFRAFIKAKEYGLPVGAAVPKQYSEYYNAAFDFLFNKLKADTGATFPDSEYRRRAALNIANLADSPNFSAVIRGERARYINEQMSGLSNTGRSFVVENYPFVQKYLIQQR